MLGIGIWIGFEIWISCDVSVSCATNSIYQRDTITGGREKRGFFFSRIQNNPFQRAQNDTEKKSHTQLYPQPLGEEGRKEGRNN